MKHKILFSKGLNTAAQVQEHVLNNTRMSIRSKATNLQGKKVSLNSSISRPFRCLLLMNIIFS